MPNSKIFINENDFIYMTTFLLHQLATRYLWLSQDILCNENYLGTQNHYPKKIIQLSGYPFAKHGVTGALNARVMNFNATP